MRLDAKVYKVNGLSSQNVFKKLVKDPLCEQRFEFNLT